jgi:hypothetical protein
MHNDTVLEYIQRYQIVATHLPGKSSSIQRIVNGAAASNVCENVLQNRIRE